MSEALTTGDEASADHISHAQSFRVKPANPAQPWVGFLTTEMGSEREAGSPGNLLRV